MPKTKEELAQLKLEYDALKTKLNELSESELKEVVGGQGGDRSVVIPVTLPSTSSAYINISVYIDGQLESSLCKEVDPIVGVVNLTIKGTRGFVSVSVKIDGVLYKNYSVNFDNCTYNEI